MPSAKFVTNLAKLPYRQTDRPQVALFCQIFFFQNDSSCSEYWEPKPLKDFEVSPKRLDFVCTIQTVYYADFYDEAKRGVCFFIFFFFWGGAVF